MEWRWTNEYRIVELLRQEDDEARGAVLDALDRILEDPFDPYGVDVHKMRGKGAREDRRIAWLPRGFVLTYQPYLNGPPPLAGNHVSVVAFSKYEWLEGFEPPDAS